MIKKGGIGLVLLLVIILTVLGISLYHYNFKKPVIPQKEEIVEQPAEEPKEEVILEENITIDEFKEPEETPKEVTIYISRFDFDKPEITIEPGTKVIWENTDTRRHMITNKRIGLFRTMRKSLELGDTFEYTFNQPGTYEILEANFGINGLVVVKEKEYLSPITGNIVKDVMQNNLVHSIETDEKKNLPGNNLITGQVVKNVEVSGISFVLVSVNIFVLSVLALVIGFYVSRHQKRA